MGTLVKEKMSVQPIVEQPTVYVAGKVTTGEWDAPLCGCCEPAAKDLCCKTTCMPCITQANIANATGDHPTGMLALAFIAYFLPYGTNVIAAHQREQTRKRFNIPGTFCEDCCCALFCGCCVIIQTARQNRLN